MAYNKIEPIIRRASVGTNYSKSLSAAFIVTFLLFLSTLMHAQSVPADEENIPYLVTFGSEADKSWGDDDFCQIFFALVPKGRIEPVFLRIYDPDTGAKNDEPKGPFNTQVNYTVYGGNNCWSDKDAKGIDPVGNYKSGMQLASKVFGNDSKYDNSWYTFGPINPFEGEYVEELGGRVFKIIAEGINGDDGNLYKYFLSENPVENIPVEGGNLFTYEYCFRLSNDNSQVSQIYPYVDDKTISVKILNYDWDFDGQIKLISIAKNGLQCNISGEGEWKQDEFPILDKEKNTSLEILFVKNKQQLVQNNNVCVIVQNQYGNSLPFYVIPIGGAPVYNPQIIMRSVE